MRPCRLALSLAGIMALAGCQGHRMPSVGSVRSAGSAAIRVNPILTKLRAVVPPDTCRQYHFVTSAIPNASMDAHGNLALSTGLLRLAETDDLLAFAIAHELSHAVLRHPARLRRAGWLQLIASAAVAWAAHEAAGSKSDAAFAGGGFFLSSAVFGTLPLMRRMEKEADLMARDILRRAGFNAGAGAEFWKTYAAARPHRLRPCWLSAHPPDAERIRYLKSTPAVP